MLGWRDVPTDDSPIGPSARAAEPVDRAGRSSAGAPAVPDRSAFERKLYVIRKRAEHAVRGSDLSERKYFYLPSLSANTLIYKGMLSADQIETMFPDVDGSRSSSPPWPSSTSASPPTRFPSWPLAHPYRYIAHNGEINTLRGNINWMRAREALCRSRLLGDDLKQILPIVVEGGSDSAVFDNVLEFLVMAGRPLPLAVLMMIPGGVERARVHGGGAAGLLRVPRLPHGAVGRARLHRLHRRHRDRRRARPERAAPLALLRHQGRDGGDGLRGGRARHPGRARADQGAPASRAHLPRGHRAGPHHRRRGAEAHLRDAASLRRVAEGVSQAAREPARAAHRSRSPTTRRCSSASRPSATRTRICASSSAPMAANGEEPVGSMGTDTSLAVLSNRPRLLYDYFKQLFAQVTNPPLDGIREELVTQIATTHRARGQSPRADARRLPADQAQDPDPRQRRAGADPPRGPARLQGRHRAPCSSRSPTARWASRAPWPSSAARRARPSPTATPTSSCRTAGWIASTRRSPRSSPPRACTIT